MHFGSEPGTGISDAWSRATIFQPNSSAALAGNAASRSLVTVKSPLTMSSGWRSLAEISARSSSSVAARISLASLCATVVAPRIPWRRAGDIMADNVVGLARLMLVTDDSLLQGRDLVALARSAERGGVSSLQLRLKQSGARELVQLARTLVAALEIPVLVNDRPDVAIAAGAAGVHLGPDDMPVHLARRIAPPGFIIGASVGSEVEADASEGADYWGVGPWRDTATKGDAGAGLGAEGFGRLAALARGRPCIAIGGVRPEDVPAVMSRGGSGVAVVSGILVAADVEAAARAYVKAGQ